MNDLAEAVLATILLFVIIAASFSGGYNSKSYVESKTRIRPDLHIEYKNGVADTTFIYRIK